MTQGIIKKIAKIIFAGVFVLSSIIILVVKCGTDNTLSPYDPNYKGDYKLILSPMGSSDIYAFIPYRISYRSGSDKYQNIRAFTQPENVLDSLSFLIGLSSDSMCFYFKKPFSGKICIEAERPNSIKDTFYIQNIEVKLPFQIIGPSLLMQNDSVEYQLDTLNNSGNAISQLKNIFWYLNSIPYDTLRYFDDKLKIKADSSLTEFSVSAICEDLKGNLLPLKEVKTSVSKNVPIFISLMPQKSYFMPKDSIMLNATLKSFIGDTSVLVLVANKDTIKKNVLFITDTTKVNIKFKAKPDTGTYNVSAWFVNKLGFKSKTISTTYTISIPKPQIISFLPQKSSYSPGDSLSFNINLKSFVNDTGLLIVYANLDSVKKSIIFKDSLTNVLITGFKNTILDTGTFNASAYYTNIYGIKTTASQSYNVGTTGPIISIPISSDTLIIGINEAHTFSVIGNAKKYVWDFSNGIKDTTEEPQLTKIVFTDSTQNVILNVYGIDSYGYKGNTVKITIKCTRFYYSANFVKAPATSKIKDTLVWKVLVKSNIDNSTNKSGTYTFTLYDNNNNLIDSVSALNLDTFKYVAKDSNIYVLRFVYKDDLGKSSSQIESIVTVRLLKPKITLISKPSQFFTNISACISFKASDSAGLVKMAFLKVDTIVNVNLSSSDTQSQICFTPKQEGKKILMLWAQDNDNLLSDTIKDTITVLSSNPQITLLETSVSTIYRMQSVKFIATAQKAPTNSKITEYHWKFDSKDTITTVSSINWTFETSGSHTVKVFCVDSLKMQSPVFEKSYNVDAGIPVVTTITLPQNKNIYSDQAFIVSIIASDNEGGSVDSFKVLLTKDKDSLIFSYDSKDIQCIVPFGKEGTYQVFAKVKDNISQWCNWTQAKDSVNIIKGEPIINKIELVSGNKVYNGDTLKLSITAQDPRNGIFDACSIKVANNKDSMYYVASSIDTIKCPIPLGKEGNYKVFAKIRSNMKGLWSNWTKSDDSVDVISAIPVITAIDLPTGNQVFSGISFKINITATSPEGISTDSFKVMLKTVTDSLIFNSASKSVSCSISIGNIGYYKVFAKVKNNLGQWSNWTQAKDSLRIVLGDPIISLISLPSGNSVYSGNYFNISVTAQDPRGSGIDSFMVKLIKGTDSLLFKDDTSKLNCIVNIGKEGTYQVYAMAKSKFGLWSSKWYKSDSSLTVILGKPSVVSFRLQDTVWIKKQTTILIQVNDPDGKVDTLFINWGDGNSSKIYNPINENLLTISANHTWNTYPANGLYNVSIRLKDNLGVMSDLQTYPVGIHLGKPTIKLISTDSTKLKGDTLYTKYNTYYKAPPFYITTQAYDTNGTVVKYIYVDTIPLDTSNPIAVSDSSTIMVSSNWKYIDWSQDSAYQFAVFAIDNDGFVGGDTSYVVLDRPPTYISISQPSYQDTIRSRDNVYLSWSGGADHIDGLDVTCEIFVLYNYVPSSYMYRDTVLVKTASLKTMFDSYSLTFYTNISIPSQVNYGQPIAIMIRTKDSLNQYNYSYFPSIQEVYFKGY
jgi:hypothetical protein